MVSRYLDVDYTAGKSSDDYQKLDLFVPGDSSVDDCVPLLVFFHGGSWRSGHRKDWSKWAETVCERGKFAVAVPSYRLALNEPKNGNDFQRYPTQEEDCSSAVTFLAKTKDYPYDKDSIFLAGHSAGAHLIFMLLLRDNGPLFSRHVRGLVGLQGIYDLNSLLQKWPSYSDFLTQAFGKFDDTVYKKFSPQHLSPSLTPRLPSLLIVHSPDDELVDSDQAEQFYAHMRNLYPSNATGSVHLSKETSNRHFETLNEETTVNLLVNFVLGH